MSELQREVKRKKRIIEYADPAPTPDCDISETGNYAKSVARREGFASSLRLRRPATPLVAALPLCGTQDGIQHRKRHPAGTKMGPRSSELRLRSSGKIAIHRPWRKRRLNSLHAPGQNGRP